MASPATIATRPHLQLRDYQEEARTNVAGAYFDAHDPSWRQLLIAPTGAGKTIMFASIPAQPDIAAWMETFPPLKRKMLVLAHREELLDQAADKIAWANPDLNVDIEQADRIATPFADVVVASVQTLAIGHGRRLQKFDPDDFRIIICDEAHHATAPSYQAVFRYFGFLPDADFAHRAKPNEGDTDENLLWQRERLAVWDESCRPDRLLLGVTATPKRGDNIGLEAVFQKVVFQRDIRWMIEHKYLATIRAYRIKTTANISSVKTRAGDFAIEDLADAVDTSVRNEAAVKAYAEHAPGRKTIVSCVNVKHAQDMAECFRNNGYTAEAIYGNLDGDERKAMLQRFRAGETMILTNCMVLCLDENTELLTDTGWVSIDTVAPEHRVANWENGRIFFDTPKAIVKRTRLDDEAMVSYASPRHDFRVTEGHRMLVKSRHDDAFTLKQAFEIVGAQVQMPVCGHAEPHDITFDDAFTGMVDMSRVQKNSYAVRRSLDVPLVESRTIALERALAKDALTHIAPRDLTLAECRFIGFWLGDGTRSDLSSGGVEYSCVQSMRYRNIIDWFDGVIADCGIDVARREYPERGVVTWSFGRGTGSGPQRVRGIYGLEPYLDKNGSDLFWGLTRDQYLALLDGLDYADGIHSRTRPGFYVYNSNVPLLNLLQGIGVCRGCSATISQCSDPREPHHAQLFLMHVSPDRTCIELGAGTFQIEKTLPDTPERAWCVTSTTGNIVTRRRGHVTVTGNTEGFDEASVSCIIHARPTKSSLIYIQVTGRGLRILDGKEDCVVIDLVDISGKHSLVTAPTILGLPSGFDAEGADVVGVVKKIEEEQEKLPALDVSGLTSIKDLTLRAQQVDLFAQPSMPEELFGATTLTWSREGAEQYAVGYPHEASQETIRVDQDPLGHYRLSRYDHVFRQANPISAHQTVQEALTAGEDWLRRNRPSVVSMKARNAPWRGVKPSDPQLRLLKKLRIPVDVSKLTKGMASDLIDAHFKRR